MVKYSLNRKCDDLHRFLVLFSLVESKLIQSQSTVQLKNSTWKLVYKTNSNYGNLRVIDAFKTETLKIIKDENIHGQRGHYNDGLCQNRIDKKSGKSVVSFSYALNALISLFQQNPTYMFCIGIGAGLMPMEYAEKGTGQCFWLEGVDSCIQSKAGVLFFVDIPGEYLSDPNNYSRCLNRSS